ncbi:MAG: Stk1 family PASTA domain-containing Ser/Thr kinase [Bacilli bacterium]|nr:Stk1 family PASTA domain-containing Ser/Thr kinase [Bacilli bacterium]
MIAKGQKINDRYEIVRLIGEGGMANVYLALDTILNRYVAVKILRGDLANDEKFVRRFQREAISASSLTHPNIVEIYDVGVDDGQYFIVMEFIEGKTLKSLIKKRGALSIPEVIDIMLQLTSALACAHNSYIIHRDIKPQNVLILEDGRVKITDFGIAMALNKEEATQTNSVMGSVHYLPPEQANGSGSTIKSDIYSLGILMYELLTGHVPFRGDNAVEIAIKQMKEPIPSICKENSDIPQSIENIILRATAKNPKNRYDSVNEMYEDVKKSLDPENINQARIVYSYPEHELEATKELKDLKEEIVKADIKEKKKKRSKLNLALIISGSLFMVLLTIAGISIIFYPMFTKVAEVEIPDVSGKSLVEAETILKDAGFSVNTETEEKNDNEIEEGLVIGTSPIVGRTVKKGTEITLVVSIGEKGFTLDDFTGKNYYEVEANLKAEGMYVITEKQEVDDNTTAEENIIISQNPVAGTRVSEGDTITLYIPDIITEYPDFTDGTWTIGDIETFCATYDITLTTDYEITDTYTDGAIISQSRAAGSKVMPTTLRIVVAQTPAEEEE